MQSVVAPCTMMETRRRNGSRDPTDALEIDEDARLSPIARSLRFTSSLQTSVHLPSYIGVDDICVSHHCGSLGVAARDTALDDAGSH
jgi:hypothetical protein